MNDTGAKPDILIPYQGPSDTEGTQDVFVFMRPHTNGTLGEQAIMQTIRGCPEYATKQIRMVYLANIPSQTLITNKIYERYYGLKIHFATLGGALFTPHMKRRFSAHFNVDFDSAHVIGAFEALRELSMSTEELFRLRVPQEDVCALNGQSIKKYRGCFIVNYDIPALIHRYSLRYDIAVMCFRMNLPYDYFVSLTRVMRYRLIETKVIATDALVESAFHYSYGPFDQLRDGIFFMLNQKQEGVPLQELSFARYLQKRGIDSDTIHHLLINPIVVIDDGDDNTREISIVEHTRGSTYRQAWEILDRVIAHSLIDPLP